MTLLFWLVVFISHMKTNMKLKGVGLTIIPHVLQEFFSLGSLAVRCLGTVVYRLFVSLIEVEVVHEGLQQTEICPQ